MAGISPARKHAMAERWLALAVQTYPVPSRRFLVDQRDPFRNPAGQALRKRIPELVEELFGEMDAGKVGAALEDLMRLRAVQRFSAREAVGFLFGLKTILREESAADWETLARWEERVDELALAAFDLFMRFREQIYQIQADEARRRVAQLERMYSREG